MFDELLTYCTGDRVPPFGKSPIGRENVARRRAFGSDGRKFLVGLHEIGQVITTMAVSKYINKNTQAAILALHRQKQNKNIRLSS